ncbi:putative translation protein, beta-barrel [Medicago truncatula]|nr:putative translation protein, beta-barrel [Medicago truncatula]
MMDLKAQFDGPAQAYVVEARLDKGRGPLVTTIVKVVCGQHAVEGSQWGKIRSTKDAAGRLTQRATPAMPVEIEGIRGLPMAGDDVIVVHSEERAKFLDMCMAHMTCVYELHVRRGKFAAKSPLVTLCIKL